MLLYLSHVTLSGSQILGQGESEFASYPTFGAGAFRPDSATMGFDNFPRYGQF
jgi:hypothetical protein